MYIVSEFQTNAGTTAILNYTYTEQPIAEQKYHEILAAASISSVEIHAASIFDEFGCVYKNEFYVHEPAPVEVPEEETTEEEET